MVSCPAIGMVTMLLLLIAACVLLTIETIDTVPELTTRVVANYTTLETRSIFNSAIDKNGTELLLTNETAPLWMNSGK